MAIGTLSFVQYPVKAADKVPVITNWNPMIGYMVYQTSISGVYYYKLILEVYLGTSTSGTLIAKMKQRRNGYSSDISGVRARAFFDLRSIANTQLVDTVYDQNCDGAPFESIHKLGKNKDDGSGNSYIFSKNGNAQQAKYQIAKLYVRAGQEYSDSEDASPTENFPTSPVVADTLVYLQSTLDLFEPRFWTGSAVDTDYIQGVAFVGYTMTSATDRYLSDLPITTAHTSVGMPLTGYINHIISNDSGTTGDFHTLGFLNDGPNFDSAPFDFKVEYFKNNGVSIGSVTITNNAGAGGLKPTLVGANTADNVNRLLYFGCGPQNLASIIGTSAGVNPSNFTDWEYYTVTALDGGSSQMAAKVYFLRQQDNCKGYKTRRLSWRNSLGCYDYFNFTLKSTQTVQVQRDTYNSVLGTFNKSKYRYDDTQRGKNVRQTSATLKETLNTNWLKEEEVTLIESLLMSTNVEIIENINTDYTQGVVITDTSLLRKTVANDKMIQYTINIEYANPLNTNS